MNKVILAGRMVADPELKTTQTGVEVSSFRIAVNQDYVKQGEERKADFFNIVAWRKTAVFINQYFHKGDGINLVGKLQSRQYEANDGTNRYVTEVVVDQVEFPLSNKNQQSSNNYSAPSSVPDIQTPPTNQNNTTSNFQDMPLDDDLPF